MVDAERLGRLSGIEEVRQVTPRRLVIIARDAASATPAVVSAVEATGVSVTSIQTVRPSFDEVFVKLVERAGRALPGDGEAGEATRPTGTERAAEPGPTPADADPGTVEDVA